MKNVTLLLATITYSINAFGNATGVKILLGNEKSITSTQILFSENATPGFDKGIDKEFVNLPENKLNYIYSIEGENRKMFVNFCPQSVAYQSIPIQIAVEDTGIFILSFENSNNNYQNLHYSLSDLKSKKTIPLDQFVGTEITFNKTDLHVKRNFILHIFSSPEIATIPVSCYGGKNGSIRIAFKDETMWQAKIRIGNKTIENTTITSSETNFDNLTAGVYFVEIWKEGNKIYEEIVSIDHPAKVPAQFKLAQENSTTGTLLFTENYSKGATNWKWDFGDNTTSTEFSPTHEYAKPGYFMVTLTIADAAGCVVTSRKSLLIGTETALITTPSPKP